jgi:hypothetical protein
MLARRGIAIALLLGCGACIEPSDRRPGMRLSGPVAGAPVTDWSFSHQHREIFIETRTPYLIPHSVTIICADADGKLFVGARNPAEKTWVHWVERDPDVRLKIGDTIYEGRLSRISDPTEIEAVRAAYAAKLGGPMETAREGAPAEVWYWRVDPRPS